jgi:hypothetical protein
MARKSRNTVANGDANSGDAGGSIDSGGNSGDSNGGAVGRVGDETVGGDTESGSVGNGTGEESRPSASAADPATIAPEPAPRQKRKYTKRAEKPTSVKLDIDGNALARQILGAHMIIAMALKAPELQLAPEEAQVLSVEVAAVMKEFAFVPNAKVQAVVGLLTVSAGIYAPRFFAMTLRVKATREARRAKNPHVADVPGQERPEAQAPRVMTELELAAAMAPGASGIAPAGGDGLAPVDPTAKSDITSRVLKIA